MSAPIRILFVYHPWFLGGAARTFLGLFRYLDRERFAPVLAYGDEGPAVAAARSFGVKALPIPLGPLRRRRHSLGALLALKEGVQALRRIVREEGIALVQANVPRAILYGALAARLTGVPFIWHVGDLHRPGPYVWLVGKLAQAIVPVSQASAATLPQRLLPKTTVIHTGVDLALFAPQISDPLALKRELGLAPETPLVGNLGWIAPWKGQRRFLEVARGIAARVPEAHFIVIGGVPDLAYVGYGEELEAAGHSWLGERVHFLGARVDVPQLLAGLDLVVHTAHREPLGLVFLEAMAMRRPVVAFASGGAPEVVEHGVTGLLVPEGDLEGVAAAVAGLLEDPRRRQQMGEGARRRVEQHFSMEHTAAAFAQLYLRLLKEGRGAVARGVP